MRIDQNKVERDIFFLIKNSDWFKHHDPITVIELIDYVYKFELDNI